MNPYVDAAISNYLSEILPGLLPGLHWVVQVRVHIAVLVETHDAIHVPVLNPSTNSLVMWRNLLGTFLDLG